MTTVTARYKCCDGELSAHTSSLGLLRVNDRCAKLRASVLTTGSGKVEHFDTSQVSLHGAIQHEPLNRDLVLLGALLHYICVGQILLGFSGLHDTEFISFPSVKFKRCYKA